MKVKVIHSTKSVANKQYDDDGWEFMSEWIGGGCYVQPNEPPLSFAEKRQLVQYRNRTLPPHKINKGQRYQRQFNSYEGNTYTWRTKELFYELACRYELFPEL